MALQSKPMPGGSVLWAICSMMSSACPEEKPVAGAPRMVEAGYRLYSVISGGPSVGFTVASVPSGTIVPSGVRILRLRISSGVRR